MRKYCVLLGAALFSVIANLEASGKMPGHDTDPGTPAGSKTTKHKTTGAINTIGGTFDCTPVAPPYTENFDAVTAPALPTCTSVEDVNGGTTWTNSTTDPHSGANSLMYEFSSSLPGDDWFFTAALNLTGGTRYRFSFWYKVGTPGFPEALEVRYGQTNTAAAMSSGSLLFTNTNLINSTYAQFTTDFIPVSSGTYYIGFHSISAQDQFELFVDDISIDLAPACSTPDNVVVGSITSNSASVSFNSDGSDFIVEYGLSGFTPGTAGTPGVGGTIATGIASPIGLTGLNPNTAYDVYVRNICTGPTYSPNTPVSTFTTNCAVVTPTYTQNFAAYLPSCWSEQTGVLTNTPSGLTGTTSLWTADGWLNTGTTGAAKINLFATGQHEWLLSPSINLGVSGNYQVEFDLAILGFSDVISSVLGSDDSLAVVVSTDNGATWSTANIIAAWTAANTPVSANGVHITLPLTSYTGTVRIGFYGTSGNISNPQDADVMIDNFAVTVQPACPVPSAVSVGSITGSTASVSFSSPGGSFVVEYGPVGFTPGTGASAGINGTVQTGSSSPIGLTGLADGTSYDVYVRRNCGGGGFSTNSAVVSFNTLCTGVATIPYMERFDLPIAPAVPPCITVQNVNGGNTWRTVANDLPVSSHNIMRLDFEEDAVTPANDWFFTKGLNLVAGQSYRLRFQYRNSDAALFIEKLEVKYGTGANAAAMATTLFTNTNINFNAWQEADIDFTPPSTGVYYIGFHGFSDANQAFLAVDNVNVIPTPACDPPTNITVLQVTGTSAQVSFTSAGTSFILEYGAPGFTPGTGSTAGGGTIITGNSSPISISGLNPLTEYEVYVRRNCSGVFSPNSLVTSFLTLLPNDDAPGALPLTLGAGCSGASYTDVTATASPGEKYPSCSGTLVAPVWFKFVAPASGAVRISTDIGSGGTLLDSKVALFSTTDVNDYTKFTIISCDDDNGAFLNGGKMSVVYATGLTAGGTYYIAVDKFSSAVESGTFCIAVDELSSGMLATTNNCSSTYQTPASGGVTNYTGWQSLVDGGGNLIALVRNTAGVDVNTFTVSQNVNTGGVRTEAISGEKYLDRSYNISNVDAAATDVQLFFLNSELTALQAVDPAANLASLIITRQTGTCQSSFVAANGASSELVQAGNGSVNGVNWVSFNTVQFSNFFIHSTKTPILARVFLQGAYNPAVSRHKDVTTAWRNVLIANALNQPYNTAAFGNYNGGESVPGSFFTSDNTSNRDVVDWVLLEVRDGASTLVARKAALVREDGKIIDVNGDSVMTFNGLVTGSYYLTIRHRNHLGISSQNLLPLTAKALGVAAPTAFSFDFATESDANIFGTATAYKVVSGVNVMVCGNANGNNNVRYAQVSNDPSAILQLLGSSVTGILSNVYSACDVNMDGTVRYANFSNDPGFLLSNALGGVVTLVVTEQKR